MRLTGRRAGVRWIVRAALVALLACGGGAQAQEFKAEALDIEALLGALEGPHAVEAPAVQRTPEGFVRYLAAPANARFKARAGAFKSGDLAAPAQNFLADYAGAFALRSEKLENTTESVKGLGTRTVVKLGQQYDGVPVYGASTVVALDENGLVEYVLSDVLRDTRTLDGGDIALKPGLSEAEAISAARAHIAEVVEGVGAPQLMVSRQPSLVIFRPDVLGLQGPTALAWRLQLTAISPRLVQREVLVDAASGVVLLQFSLVEVALQREVFDANNGIGNIAVPARREGDPDTGLTEVDTTFNYLADTYNFFLQEHDWRGYDGQDGPFVATVRLPIQNAFFTFVGDVPQTFYGTGWATDDIVGHEIAHGFTRATSDLIYFGFSGAINESMSDIWGEFIDLTNGAGTDNAALRWFIGEDIPEFADGPQVTPEGETEGELEGQLEGEVEGELEGEDDLPPGIRSMQDPTIFDHPDRLGSDLLFDTESFFDNGGVHFNSGIGNKLAYLLTDGDSFNGETVEGLGISRVADLYFGAQFLLTSSADYNDLYFALRSSASQLEFTEDEFAQLEAAARAVEIAPPAPVVENVQSFRATSTQDLDGNAVILLTWQTPDERLENVILVRSLTGYVNDPAQGQVLTTGRLSSYVDRDVIPGVRYYYTLIATYTNGESLPLKLPETFYATAVAGQLSQPQLVEAFGVDFETGQNSGNDFDLSFTQILFSPTGAPESTVGGLTRGADSGNYTVSVTPSVFDLPVPREDERGGSNTMLLSDNDAVYIQFPTGQAFPFFGVLRSILVVHANGFIAAEDPLGSNPPIFPSLGAHHSIERIAFLFSDLAPNIGGEAWIRALDDRMAITFENIPEFSPEGGSEGTPNTVQVELFHSGHIRMTYLGIGAENAIVGISDGRGVPVDIGAEFPDLLPIAGSVDFNALPDEPQALTFEPIGSFNLMGGQRVEFDVFTAGVQPGEPVPVLTATWTEGGVAPFADNGDGTGTFSWQVPPAEDGVITLRVEARQASERAYVDIRLTIDGTLVLPEARNLGISTDTPLENPFEDRAVDTNRPLIALYEYFHPQMNQLQGFGEGPSLLLWFRNGESVASLTNVREVPPSLTQGGDQWYFRVMPISRNFLLGEEAISPLVYIAGYPEVLAVSPTFGSVLGGDTVRIRGQRMAGIIEVQFGGIRVPSVRVLSSTEIEVVTPAHSMGRVDVTVRSNQGVGRLAQGFTYITSAGDFRAEDVNNDGKVDAVDVQIVVSAILEFDTQKNLSADTNDDGRINSSDLQMVVNAALHR